jgi:hypothetical protein
MKRNLVFVTPKSMFSFSIKASLIESSANLVSFHNVSYISVVLNFFCEKCIGNLVSFYNISYISVVLNFFMATEQFNFLEDNAQNRESTWIQLWK